MGRVPFPQGRPQAQLEPLSILFWGSLYLSPSYSTKPPSNSDKWVRRPQKKCIWKLLSDREVLSAWKVLKCS